MNIPPSTRVWECRRNFWPELSLDGAKVIDRVWLFDRRPLLLLANAPTRARRLCAREEQSPTTHRFGNLSQVTTTGRPAPTCKCAAGCGLITQPGRTAAYWQAWVALLLPCCGTALTEAGDSKPCRGAVALAKLAQQRRSLSVSALSVAAHLGDSSRAKYPNQ